jgi:hypothetical protein
MMGDRERVLRLVYLKMMDAVELLQSIGEDLLADEAEGIAAKIGRAAVFAAANLETKQGAAGQVMRAGHVCGRWG